jgi:hypothetical protein
MQESGVIVRDPGLGDTGCKRKDLCMGGTAGDLVEDGLPARRGRWDRLRGKRFISSLQ